MRACPLCKHASISEINQKMVAGVDAAAIAREFKVPHRAAMNHKRYHLPRLLQKVHEGAQTVEAAGLRKMLVEIGADFQQLFEQFIEAKDLRAALIAKEKLLNWWSVAARMLGIDQPPEGHHEKPIDIAQAARDLFGLGELPALDVEEQRALPAAPADAAPVPNKAPEVPNENPAPTAPEPKSGPEPDAGHWEVGNDPNIEERIRRAPPVKNLYQEALDRIHAQGRRAEVGELSPANLGESSDASAAESKAPLGQCVVIGRLGCPNCQWKGPASAYAEHRATEHGKPV